MKNISRRLSTAVALLLSFVATVPAQGATVSRRWNVGWASTDRQRRPASRRRRMKSPPEVPDPLRVWWKLMREMPSAPSNGR
jgi:hypothetical protein